MADELNDWLRRVRPPTAADSNGSDSWADSDEAQRLLDEVHRRVATVRPARRARVWALMPAAVIAAAAVVLLVVMLTSPAQPASRQPVAVAPVTLRPAAKLLTPFSSCDALLAGLRAHAAAHVNVFSGYAYVYGPSGGSAFGAGPGVRAPAGPALNESNGADAQAAAAPGTSTTNVQEVGVDEPDIVKTDGDRVVSVTDGRLRVVDGSTRTVTGSLDLSMYSGWQNAEIFTAGDTAVVLLHSDPYGVAAGYLPELVPVTPSSARLRSTVLYVDLSGAPRVVGSMQADGDIVDARMVGSTVRLVVTSSPHLSVPAGADPSQIKSAIGKQPLSAWLPTYTIDGTSTRTVPCSQLSAPKDYTAASTLTVYTLDPATPNADPQPISLEADGNTVYATSTSLYVASNPNCIYCYGASQVAAPGTTQLHRFDITGSGKPTYLGSGSVPGSLLSQYSLSDYDGSLRVATTVNTPPAPGPPTPRPSAASTTSNSVYVLDAATLKITGHVDGLGKGERLYAVRFLGALGYVVTYNQVDPLYVLDLADPQRPRVMGSLQLSGFSSYLHDIGSGRLIGVGEDTTPVNEGGGVYAHLDGLLVQMFDVSNPSKPARTARITLSNTPGQAEFDPHAFLYWQPTGLIVVPVGTWSSADAGKVLAVRASGQNLQQLGTVANRASGQLSTVIERSMMVDNALWTLSSSGIRISDASTLAEQAWIDFG